MTKGLTRLWKMKIKLNSRCVLLVFKPFDLYFIMYIISSIIVLLVKAIQFDNLFYKTRKLLLMQSYDRLSGKYTLYKLVTTKRMRKTKN